MEETFFKCLTVFGCVLVISVSSCTAYTHTAKWRALDKVAELADKGHDVNLEFGEGE